MYIFENFRDTVCIEACAQLLQQPSTGAPKIGASRVPRVFPEMGVTHANVNPAIPANSVRQVFLTVCNASFFSSRPTNF